MYNIIPLILILISLSVIIVIVVRKFSALASLDVENIPAEKEARVKEQIISKRFKRNIVKWSAGLIKILKVVWQKIEVFSKWLYNKLLELKDSYKAEEAVPPDGKEQRIEELFEQSQDLIKNEELKEAEKLLIEMIGLDSKNLKAFKELGSVYSANKNYNEARETYRHILKLTEDSDSSNDTAWVYFNLALVDQEEEKYDQAQNEIKKALKIEPNNPRYLDTALEISIINKDKVNALSAYEALKKVNPDNQKLKELKQKIKKL